MPPELQADLVDIDFGPPLWPEDETVDIEIDNITPRLVFDGDGFTYYGSTGDIIWRADGYGIPVQGTSSVEYQDPAPLFDTDPILDDERYGNPYIRRYTEDELHNRVMDYLQWKSQQTLEQQDITDDRGGALDDFLNKFTPPKTNQERSDGQE